MKIVIVFAGIIGLLSNSITNAIMIADDEGESQDQSDAKKKSAYSPYGSSNAREGPRPEYNPNKDTEICTLNHTKILSSEEEVAISVRVAQRSEGDGLFDLNFITGEFAGMNDIRAWCVDLSRSLGSGDYNFDVFSSLDTSGVIHSDAVDKPELLPAINWLINKHPSGSTIDVDHCKAYGHTITDQEFQLATWLVIDDADTDTVYSSWENEEDRCVVHHLAETAREFDDYQPSCYDKDAKIGLLLVVDSDEGSDFIENQVLIAEIGIGNACDCVSRIEAEEPTSTPTPGPTDSPTKYSANGAKTRAPTTSPTEVPTKAPTDAPTSTPSKYSANVAKTRAPTTSGANGDPHFKTWSGERYDFHGICDLILLSNSKFNNNLGMDIYIRSKKTKQWSYISTAVIRIGVETFEVSGRKDGDTYWINGIEGNSSGDTDDVLWEKGNNIAGYPITFRKIHSTQREYVIDLGNHNEKIVFKTWKDFVRIDVVNPRDEDFTGSVGLMGSYPNGDMAGRDLKNLSLKKTNNGVKDWNTFGQEWQVLSSDPKLFHSMDGPQHPTRCELPTKASLRRRLSESEISREQAELACYSIVNEEERDLCIFDVMATNDKSTVNAY